MVNLLSNVFAKMGCSRLELPAIAMLDTGFTELLAVNSQDLETLGWRYLG